ncbi:hypothetical protein ACQEVS_23240 [Streptomyces sp. CA-181903]
MVVLSASPRSRATARAYDRRSAPVVAGRPGDVELLEATRNY